MIAIITGDIINSENYKSSEWLGILKSYFSKLGDAPDDWEIYRGDEFQLRVPFSQAFEVAIHIKALMKTIKGLDVRMGIGIGQETFVGIGVSESNGPAYQRSGRTFDTLKDDKTNLTVATGNGFYDEILNLMLRLALDFMNDWSIVSAEIVAIALDNPKASQQEIATELGIQQSAVSQRQKRARLDLVYDLLDYYKMSVKEISA